MLDQCVVDVYSMKLLCYIKQIYKYIHDRECGKLSRIEQDVWHIERRKEKDVSIACDTGSHVRYIGNFIWNIQKLRRLIEWVD